MKTFKLNNRRPLATLSLSAFYAYGVSFTKMRKVTYFLKNSEKDIT